MKKFAEVCLYIPNQCIIFIAAATNHVNTNILMMWQKTQTFTLKSVLLSLCARCAIFFAGIRLSNSLQVFSSITLLNSKEIRCVKSIIMLCV